MGMSASQARLMNLTSRLSDLELKAQQISNAKIRLSDMSEAASRDYTAALDKQTLTIKRFGADGTSGYAEATLNKLYSTQPLDNGAPQVEGDMKLRYVTDNSGKVYMPPAILAYFNAATSAADFATSCGATKPNSEAYKYYTSMYNDANKFTPISNGVLPISSANANNSEWLQSQIEAGNILLKEYDPNGGTNGTGSFENVSWSSGDSTLVEKTDNTETAKAEAKYESTMAVIKSKDERFDLQLKSIDTEHTAIQTEIDSVNKVISKNIERSFKIFQG